MPSDFHLEMQAWIQAEDDLQVTMLLEKMQQLRVTNRIFSGPRLRTCCALLEASNKSGHWRKTVYKSKLMARISALSKAKD